MSEYLDGPRLGAGWWLRVAGLAVFDGVILLLVPILLAQESTGALIVLIAATAIINYVFLASRGYPFRWVTPGMFFVALFMLVPIGFTVYIAFTNWSTGHTLTKDQAIERITTTGAYLVETEDSPIVDMYLYGDPATIDPADPAAGLKMLVITPDGDSYLGQPRLTTDPVPEEITLDDPSEVVVVDSDADGIPESIDGLARLRLGDVAGIASTLDLLVLDIPGKGQARARTFSTAVLAEQRFVYDEASDVLVDSVDGGTCPAVDAVFVCNGQLIDPGWRETVGFANFASILGDERIRAPFLRIFLWNVVFAILAVVGAGTLGIMLAVTLDESRIRFRGFWRALIIIPYAAPGFITILVWRGLFNQTFGPLNRLLDAINPFVTDVAIPWLSHTWWSRLAVIIVTMWAGFPYYFMIASGALQSIPPGLKEAARIDGASGPTVFRKITFPLLMVSIAPLAVAGFAFAFNNFVLIFLLTRGGPAVPGYTVAFGDTDILISFIYNLAVASGRGGQFGLATAATFFLFFIVAFIAAVSFRFTKRLENIYGGL